MTPVGTRAACFKSLSLLQDKVEDVACTLSSTCLLPTVHIPASNSFRRSSTIYILVLIDWINFRVQRNERTLTQNFTAAAFILIAYPLNSLSLSTTCTKMYSKQKFSPADFFWKIFANELSSGTFPVVPPLMNQVLGSMRIFQWIFRYDNIQVYWEKYK